MRWGPSFFRLTLGTLRRSYLGGRVASGFQFRTRNLMCVSQVWNIARGINYTLQFFSMVPTFGADGNYIALLHEFDPVLSKLGAEELQLVK